MTKPDRPTISAVVAAYQAEEWIADAIDSILGQTSPPDEVVVVDDGSADGTAAVLEAYRGVIRVVHQDNAGYPTAMNRAIREARGEFVALCGADDVWEPRKLEWQREAVAANAAEAGVLFGHAVFFGLLEGDHLRPRGSGLLDSTTLAEDLFRAQPINTPSTVIRRELFDRVGWFPESSHADDYDFFFRCLRAGVRFYYDPRTLVRYRRHDANLSDRDVVRRAMMVVRSRNIGCIGDRQLVCDVMAPDLIRIARGLVDEGRPRHARQVFRRSLRYARGNPASVNARALIWIGILSLPRIARDGLVETAVRASHAMHGPRDGRSLALR